MATRLTHKNTGIKDKPIRPDQLGFGEFAINWHESGPFVQVKDEKGRIIRVGGVVIQDEQPGLAQKGAFWLSLRKNALFIYTGDFWHPITGQGEASAPPEVAPPGDGMLTIQLEDGTSLGTFTANQISNAVVTIPASTGPPAWGDIPDKPECFPACEHEHSPPEWGQIQSKPCLYVCHSYIQTLDPLPA